MTDPSELLFGDTLTVLPQIPDESIEAVVTDPPYGLSDFSSEDVARALGEWLGGRPYFHRNAGFRGADWDAFVPGPEVWKEAYRVLKPGGYVLAFAGTRTFDLMTIALRLSGFEIRDSIAWIHSQGFPKGLDLSRAIDKRLGTWSDREVIGKATNGTAYGHFADDPSLQRVYERTAAASPEAKTWEGWNTTLKPSFEPVAVARKPFPGTLVENVLARGVGGLNVKGCELRVDGEPPRWPGNVVLGHLPGCREILGARGAGCEPECPVARLETLPIEGGASRFFYAAKPSRAERTANGRVPNPHPTVKPVALMRYLCRLVTPLGGRILDPFLGSGTTGVASIQEGFRFVGIEREKKFYETARGRIGVAADPSCWTDPPESEPEIESSLEGLLGM